MALDVLQGRPIIENTPSGLRKITRFAKLNGDGARIANIASYFDAYGSADAEFPTAVLIEQRIDRRAEQGLDLTLIKVYQELVDNALTATTEVFETTLFDGRRITRRKYLCKSSQAASLRPAIGSGSPAIFQVDIEEFGPVATVTTYAIEITDSGFVYADETETRNNGALILRTIRTLAEAAATPAGFTLVTSGTTNQDGYTVYVSTFAKGNGEISRQTDYLQSIDGGTTGVTRVSVRHLTDPSVNTNPIATPSGMVKISESLAEQDGYRLWEATFAKGAGTVLDTVDLRNGGKLVIYHKAALGSAPAAPTATIGGTVTLISSGTRNESGYVVYDYTWAEGTGEISRETDYRQSSDQGATGATIVTIRHLSPLATSSNPITTPAGMVLISEGKTEQDGYRVWTGVYAKGAGLVLDASDTRNNGKLIVYRRVGLGTAPTAPAATIDGTVVEISTSTRNESGYQVIEKSWAEGEGVISSSTDTRNNGKLVVYRISALGTAPDAPSATIAGTVVQIGSASREQDGVTLYEYAWAEGIGTIASDVDTRNGGKLILYRISALGVAPTAPAATIGGTVTAIATNTREQDGVTLYEYAWAEGIGEISRDTDYRQSSDEGTTGATVITIRHLTSLATGTNPISTPAGTVLISVAKADQEGHRLWTAVYAKGTGLVTDESDIRVIGKLVSYHRVAMGAPPDAPTATVGGTVTLVASGVRKENGFSVYDYHWAEANGQTTIETVGQPDGAIDTIITSIDVAAATPSSPGAGNYLIRLTQEGSAGHFVNRAVYRKPPLTKTVRDTVGWRKPGSLSIASPDPDLIFVPPTEIIRLASIEISYGESQDETEAFTVDSWANLRESYTISATGQVVVRQEALHGILSGATGSSSSSPATYHGVAVDNYSYAVGSSTPSSVPSGDTIIDVKNTPYLTALDGTVVYERRIVTIDV